MTSGFRKLDEDTRFEGYAIRVAVGRFAAPDGEEFTRDLIHHPGAVGVFPLHDDDTVTLVRQYRAPLDDWLLEIPAGLRDVAGEDPAEVARRELIEEVGLKAGSVEWLTAFHNAPGASDEVCHVYLGTDLTPVPGDLQGVEEQHMEVVRMPFERLLHAVRAGEVTDSKTVIGTLLVAVGGHRGGR